MLKAHATRGSKRKGVDGRPALVETSACLNIAQKVMHTHTGDRACHAIP